MNDKYYKKRRIILANRPRLLRELFKRAFQRFPEVKVVGEVIDSDNLPSRIEKLDAHWIIVSLQSNGEFPKFTKLLFQNYPGIGIIAISNDGSEVKARCGEIYADDLAYLTLNELIDMIQTSK